MNNHLVNRQPRKATEPSTNAMLRNIRVQMTDISQSSASMSSSPLWRGFLSYTILSLCQGGA